MLAPKCDKCLLPISGGFIPYKESKLHLECFVCSSCATPLSGKSFAEDQGVPCCTSCMEKKRLAA